MACTNMLLSYTEKENHTKAMEPVFASKKRYSLDTQKKLRLFHELLVVKSAIRAVVLTVHYRKLSLCIYYFKIRHTANQRLILLAGKTTNLISECV